MSELADASGTSRGGHNPTATTWRGAHPQERGEAGGGRPGRGGDGAAAHRRTPPPPPTTAAHHTDHRLPRPSEGTAATRPRGWGQRGCTSTRHAPFCHPGPAQGHAQDTPCGTVGCVCYPSPCGGHCSMSPPAATPWPRGPLGSALCCRLSGEGGAAPPSPKLAADFCQLCPFLLPIGCVSGLTQRAIQPAPLFGWGGRAGGGAWEVPGADVRHAKG